MKLNNVDISYTSYKIINEKNKHIDSENVTNILILINFCRIVIGLSTAIIRRKVWSFTFSKT